MITPVLVINAGSSSLKYQLLDADTGATEASGLIERIGESNSYATHTGPNGEHRRDAACPDHRNEPGFAQA